MYKNLTNYKNKWMENILIRILGHKWKVLDKIQKYKKLVGKDLINYQEIFKQFLIIKYLVIR